MHPFFRFAKSNQKTCVRSDVCARWTNGEGKQVPDSVSRRVRPCRLFLGEQLRQHFFRAQMMCLALVPVLFPFPRTPPAMVNLASIEAARVEAAIFGAVCGCTHRDLRKYPYCRSLRRRFVFPGGDSHHLRMFTLAEVQQSALGCDQYASAPKFVPLVRMPPEMIPTGILPRPAEGGQPRRGRFTVPI